MAMVLAPVASSAWVAACAADVGDAAKKEGVTVPVADSSVPPSVEAGPPGSDAAPPPPPPAADAATSILDATSFADATSPADTTAPPGDASPLPEAAAPPDDASPPDEAAPVDTGPPPPPPTGCATGAMMVAMTKLGASGNFGSAGAVCVTYMGTVSGWNASSVTGRTVTAVGSTTQTPTIMGDQLGNQPGLAPGADGYIYWNFSAGSESYSAMSTF